MAEIAVVGCNAAPISGKSVYWGSGYSHLGTGNNQVVRLFDPIEASDFRVRRERRGAHRRHGAFPRAHSPPRKPWNGNPNASAIE